jgi:hypothetical protein
MWQSSSDPTRHRRRLVLLLLVTEVGWPRDSKSGRAQTDGGVLFSGHLVPHVWLCGVVAVAQGKWNREERQ